MGIQGKAWAVKAAVLIGMGLASAPALALLPREVSKPLAEAQALVDRAQDANEEARELVKAFTTLIEKVSTK